MKYLVASFCLGSILLSGCDSGKQEPKATASQSQPASISVAPAPVGVSTPLPKLADWVAGSASVKLLLTQAGLSVEGNGSRYEYQVVSPAIEVEPNKNVKVVVDYKAKSGVVCPGILNGDRGSWLSNSDKPTSEVAFNTGANKTVFLVLANCNEKLSGNPPSIFEVTGAKLIK